VDPTPAEQPMLVAGINQFFYSDFSDFSNLETLANSNKTLALFCTSYSKITLSFKPFSEK
jgi:hypothetical protein